MLAVIFIAGYAGQVCDVRAANQVALAQDGKAIIPIVAGSVKDPVDELNHFLNKIVGDEFQLAEGRQKTGAIYVGLVSDFPWLKEREFAAEEFALNVVESEKSVYVLGGTPLGVRHGVTTLLHQVGCRWFFPGDVWEVIPHRRNLWVHDAQVTSQPAFPTQRRIWYGFGAYGPCKEDYENWMRHNRMGGPLEVSIGHSWAGLNAEKDFSTHPEWFALVGGRRQPSKPCYAHPDVIARAKESALRRAEQGAGMISMTPPDGLGYCECEKCLAAAGVQEVYEEKGCLFGKRDDGAVVNVTSETVFGLANEVAKTVAAKYPKTLIGCYAYSAYSHPPSFKLHPNVYLQTTTAYRRTPLSLEEQVSAYGEKTEQLGIREYYSVYQWDWDYPDPGKMTPDTLQHDLSQFHNWGVTAVNGEASNNWAARGLGYYVAARLMWDVKEDTNAIVKDFYEKAFGPAAKPMERYFVRWYGPSVAAIAPAEQLPQQVNFIENRKHNVDALRDAYRDLDNAMRMAKGNEAVLARIDHLRMYLHYLVLRYELEQAEATKDETEILAAIGRETMFGSKLTYTNMLHTRPLLGKAFLRRFRKHTELLEHHEPAQQREGAWRKVGQPPNRDELDEIWKADKKRLGI